VREAGPPRAPAADGAILDQALQAPRDGLAALQKMQEQTAQLHRQFLEGQEAAQRTQNLGATGGRLALWLGLMAAIVALTTAMGQIERGANRIYGIERDRPAVQKYSAALLMALTAGLLSLLGFLVIIAGDALGDSLAATYGWGETRHNLWSIGRWPIGVLLAWGSFTVVVERAPRRRQPGYSWLAFGSGVSLALWLLLTGLLALYVDRSESFGTTYGPLTGIFAFLLWANLSSVALFLGIATRSGRPLLMLPRFAVADVHRFASLAGTLLVVLHIALLFFDPYAQLRLVAFIVPFLGAYRPLWLGLGTLVFDLLAVVMVTSLLRHRLGVRVFRAVHWATYAVWPVAMAHALGNGTDAGHGWFLLFAGCCAVTVCGALGWRLHANYTEYAGTRTSGRP